ncbi:MAG: ABC transporter permease [Methanomassiliicoccales archaeon]|jgi:lipopolysaccharide transport system permease protein
MDDKNITVVSSKKKASSLGLSDLWAYRELLYFLTWKDIKIRYKQTVIGVAWAVINPLVNMVVFTLIFGGLAKIPSGGMPYAIFVYPTLILWTYFSGAVTNSTNSLVRDANLLSKVYFPRILIPMSACVIGLVDYAIAAVILIGLMAYFQVAPTISIVFVLLPLVVTVILASGLGFWLSTISVKYRDIQYVVPFFVQILMFASPVLYAGDLVPQQYSFLFNLNPLTGIMTAQRAMILGNASIDWFYFGLSFIMSLTIFITGMLYFKRYERRMADVI